MHCEIKWLLLEKNKMQIIGLVNQKGGVGKTTLSIHIASGLHHLGFKVCLIDTDPQGSLRDWHGLTNLNVEMPIFNADMKGLTHLIAQLSSQFDYAIIDGAPRSDRMASIVIRSCDLVLIPVGPSGLDAWACADIVEPIDVIQAKNQGKPIARFILNKVRKGTLLGKEIHESLKEYGIPILKAPCVQREIYAQAISEGKTALEASHKDAQEEIVTLIKEIIEVIKYGYQETC